MFIGFILLFATMFIKMLFAKQWTIMIEKESIETGVSMNRRERYHD